MGYLPRRNFIGQRKVTPMRALKIAAVAALLAAFATMAHAADIPPLPLKAQPLAQSAATGGFYWGVGTSAAVAQSSVSSNLLATALVNGNVTADGGTVDGEIGWVGSIAGYWTRFAVEGSYENVTATVAAGNVSASIASRWAVTERADVGAEIVQTIVAAIPGFSNFQSAFPTLAAVAPPGVSVGTPMQYFGGILREEGLQGNIGTVSGTTALIAPGVETGWIWPTLNAAGKPNGGAVDIFAQVDWPTKGLQVNNLFATGGAPMIASGSATIGTEYRAGIHVLFP